MTGRLAVAPSTTQVAARIDQATTAISQQWPRRPDVVVILGTGLGLLAADVVAEATIPYPRIPHFPRATATSHRGRLVCGLLDDVPVATMEGRLHPTKVTAWQVPPFPSRSSLDSALGDWSFPTRPAV